MAEHVEDSALETTEAPFPPSWIDRLIQWIDRLPGPSWLYHGLGVLALALLINAVLWMDGSVPYGSVGSIQGIFPPFVFYFLALYHYLTRLGSRSPRSFRPLLDVDKVELAQIDYEFATLPRRLGWLAIALGLAFTPPYFLGDRLAFGDLVPRTALPYLVAVVAAGFFGATILLLLIRSIRQLQMVRKLHAQATNINLLKLEPAHSFSSLTARTGIGVILILVLGAFYNPSAIGATWTIFGYVVIALPAAVIFAAPVIGMRDRLREEKRRALNETVDLLQMTSHSLEGKIRNGDYDHLQGMDTAIKALIRKRELLEKIPTWPWNLGTFRGFASTLLLPILLWVVTRLLGKFV